MKIQVKKQVGKTEFTFDVDQQDDIQALSVAGFLSSMPDKCELCQSENVHLSSNKAKGYTFVKVICGECNGRSQLGQYKDGGFFWKRFEKYEPPTQIEENKGS